MNKQRKDYQALEQWSKKTIRDKKAEIGKAVDGMVELVISKNTGVGATGDGIPIEKVNKKALEQIEENKAGAYGYVPKPGTDYAKFDFTDLARVKDQRINRIEYLNESKQLYNEIQAMEEQGYTKSEIATYAVNTRNQQKIEARKNNAPEEIAVMEERNIRIYGNPIGPTAEGMFRSIKKKLQDLGQYKSDAQVWDIIIQKALKKDIVLNTLLGIMF